MSGLWENIDILICVIAGMAAVTLLFDLWGGQ
jgi:hypothetical protein